MKDFIEFVREQGVVGLAIGFILGAAIKDVVSSLVDDIINPIVGILMGPAGELDRYKISIGNADILWGSFVATAIDFLIVAAIVFYGFKALKLEKLDRKKN